MCDVLPRPYLERVSDLRKELKKRNLDNLLVTSRANVRYLTGFAGSSGWLLVSDSAVTLLTDSRYIEQARRDIGEQCVCLASAGLHAAVAAALASSGEGTLGFEAEQLSFAAVRKLESALSASDRRCELRATDGIVEGLRLLKDDRELELMRQAAALADGALDHAMKIVRPGMTEKELAWQIERWLREHGSGPVPFNIIVASGPESALPHATPGDRRIAEGEPIVIDLGATWQGYCSDLTRTLFLGRMSQPFDAVYETALAAHLAALDGARVGMDLSAVDEIARKVIRDAGFGDYFTHGLGHGVGLEVHEQPVINARSSGRMLDRMVYTIEPGVYFPGKGGVRIEDTVVMLSGIPRSLARSRKENPVL